MIHAQNSPSFQAELRHITQASLPENSPVHVCYPQIKAFLYTLKRGNINEENYSYLAGSSRHSALPLAIHSIPFSAVRLSHFAGRLRVPSFGCSAGSIFLTRTHSLSVSSYLFAPTPLVYITICLCVTFIFQTRPGPCLKNGRGLYYFNKIEITSI